MATAPWAKVIVPLDTSRTAEVTLPWAAMLARDRAMSVHLVTVWDKEAPIPGVVSEGAVPELERYLREVAERNVFREVPVTTVVAVGDVVEQIRVAANHPGNLLLLASH